MPETESLTFAALDGIAFAAARDRLGALPEYVAGDLGPLIEMIQLARTGLLPPPRLGAMATLERDRDGLARGRWRF
ncbi:hypothetical protein ACVOMS_25545 [Bradyrhizobium guangxiense]